MGTKYSKDNSFLAVMLSKAKLILIVSLILLQPNSFASEIDTRFSAVEINRGAYLFGRYCTLCHGVDGLGEGVLTIRIDNYPSANLVGGEQRFNSLQELVEVIADGGVNTQLKVSESMPPYKDEIAPADLGYIAKFIQFLRVQNEPATEILKGNIALLPLRRDAGRELFKTHCVLCHGKEGLGNGRMAKLMKIKKAPAPANLTKTTLPEGDILAMITNGGEANGRSPYMPPWGQQLSKRQLKAVTEYVKTLSSVKEQSQ